MSWACQICSLLWETQRGMLTVVGIRLKVVGRLVLLLLLGDGGSGRLRGLALLALLVHAPALVEGLLDRHPVVGELLGQLLELGLQLRVLLEELVHGRLAVASSRRVSHLPLVLGLAGRGRRQFVQTEDQRIVLQHGDQQLVVGQVLGRDLLRQRSTLLCTPADCHPGQHRHPREKRRVNEIDE